MLNFMLTALGCVDCGTTGAANFKTFQTLCKGDLGVKVSGWNKIIAIPCCAIDKDFVDPSNPEATAIGNLLAGLPVDTWCEDPLSPGPVDPATPRQLTLAQLVDEGHAGELLRCIQGGLTPTDQTTRKNIDCDPENVVKSTYEYMVKSEYYDLDGGSDMELLKKVAKAPKSYTFVFVPCADPDKAYIVGKDARWSVSALTINLPEGGSDEYQFKEIKFTEEYVGYDFPCLYEAPAIQTVFG